MLFTFKETANFEIVAEKMNKQYCTSHFTILFDEETIKNTLYPLGGKLPENANNQYIKCKIVLVKEGQLQNFYKKLAPLFYKKVFVFLSVLSFVATLFSLSYIICYQ